MVSLKELRMVLPLTMDEYERGAVHALTSLTSEKAEEGKPAIVLERRRFTDHRGTGDYAVKKMFMKNEIPAIIRAILPESSQIIKEESWSYFPRYHAIYTNDFFGSSFGSIVDTVFAADSGTSDNIFNLTNEELKLRKVVHLNLCDQSASETRYDPSKFKSQVTGRGPITSKDWYKANSCNYPVICCYKLIRLNVAFGVGFIMVPKIEHVQADMMHTLMRRILCTMDQWYDLSYEQCWQRELENSHTILCKIPQIRDLPQHFYSLAKKLLSEHEKKRQREQEEAVKAIESPPANIDDNVDKIIEKIVDKGATPVDGSFEELSLTDKALSINRQVHHEEGKTEESPSIYDQDAPQELKTSDISHVSK